MLGFFLIGCGEDSSSNSFEGKQNIVTGFLRDVSNLETDSNQSLIASFKLLAEEIAVGKTLINKKILNRF